MFEQKMDIYEVKCEIGGRTLSIETGRFARQAGGAVLVRYGDTTVLVASTAAHGTRPGMDFFPLTVDFREKMYAAGKVPGGFFKREGRPSTKEIITCRLIDRPIRPLFPKAFKSETQVLANVLSYDGTNQPDIMGIIGASASLLISDIPFTNPVGAVKIGFVDGEFVVNPLPEQLEKSDLDLVVAGTRDAICMVESAANELSEDQFVAALELAHNEIKKMVDTQDELRSLCGKEKREVEEIVVNEELVSKVKNLMGDRLNNALSTMEKHAREEAVNAAFEHVTNSIKEEAGEEYEEMEKEVNSILHDMERDAVRSMICKDKRRVDDRSLEEIRPINIETGVIPRTHGSALFTRGQTQALAILTLGSARDEQIIDGLDDRVGKKFMLHYNFPPFSVGEVRMLRGTSRREIGHGFLAERSVQKILPPETEFPYTMRIVSEILESNGSSSMATVCASSLALMDAGVPVKKPVAGVAMGLVKEGDDVAILTDIQGLEDHLGDMDFKVTGTRDGITALQMDIKIDGLTREIMANALSQAKDARMYILDRMEKALPTSNQELSPYAPRIISIFINPSKIGTVIGPGGKTIKEITEKTGVDIEIDDSGRVDIISNDAEKANLAVDMVKGLTDDIEIGRIFKGKVTRLMNFGAFVQILPGQEGLVHISQLDVERVNSVEDVVKVGDEILVKVMEIDNLGRINLSRKAAIQGDTPSEGGRDQSSSRSDSRSNDRPRGDRNNSRGRDNYRGDRNRGDRSRNDRNRGNNHSRNDKPSGHGNPKGESSGNS